MSSQYGREGGGGGVCALIPAPRAQRRVGPRAPAARAPRGAEPTCELGDHLARAAPVTRGDHDSCGLALQRERRRARRLDRVLGPARRAAALARLRAAARGEGAEGSA